MQVQIWVAAFNNNCDLLISKDLIYAPNNDEAFSEALILALTNPQYDKRLLIELHVQYMKIASSELVENMLCTQIVFCFCFAIQNYLCTQNVLLSSL